MENFLKAKKVLTGAVKMDDLEKYPAQWRDYVQNNVPGLVKAVAEWATAELTDK